ncbi:hypothetical protein [Streptomyces sp. NPDC048606]|uniref:hypothetical protein n=1 Tax=Streptomyces sp. NPDC048606 TaxID=3154726 RepID=UPI0034195C27
MSIRTTLTTLARRLRRPEHPDAAVLPDAAHLLVRAPQHGARWPHRSPQQVAWQLAGVLGHPLDVRLVTIEFGLARTAAVLAEGLEPGELRTAITVPEVPAGTYRVLVTSAGAPDAYSAEITVTGD